MTVSEAVDHASGYADARPTWAEVDLDAITHNIALIRERAGRPIKLLVPVKANAYGHGVAAVGMHLESLGVEGLATANVDDAVAVRRAGATLPILLYGAQLPSGNHTCCSTTSRQRCTRPNRCSRSVAWRPTRDVSVNVHIKVDAGMGRLGVRLDDAAAFAREVITTPNVRLEGIYTHIPFSDDDGEAWSRRRLQAFAEMVRAVENEHRITIDFVQAAASSVFAQALPDTLNTISPGHVTFGLHPITGSACREFRIPQGAHGDPRRGDPRRAPIQGRRSPRHRSRWPRQPMPPSA